MALILLNFFLDQLPSVFIEFLNKLFQRKYHNQLFGTRNDDDDEYLSSDSQSLDSEMSQSGSAVWFDGVDKKLIEVHSRPKETIVEALGRGSLITRTPLLSYKAILKRRKQKVEEHDQPSSSKDHKTDGNSAPSLKDMIKPTSAVTDELALDCEMVECYGHRSVLARVSVVNLFGHPILDSYVAPPSQVTDYRTRYSGIRKRDLDRAPDFVTVQAQVSKLIKDRIVIGHAIHNDFAVLKLNHPFEYIRDTSKYFGRNYFLGKAPSLKKLSESVLGVKIQQGEHDSVQDAQATMKLYVTFREKWEETILKKGNGKLVGPVDNHKKKKQKTIPKKRKIKAFFVETL